MYLISEGDFFDSSLESTIIIINNDKMDVIAKLTNNSLGLFVNRNRLWKYGNIGG
jgi:hypothetical protein